MQAPLFLLAWGCFHEFVCPSERLPQARGCLKGILKEEAVLQMSHGRFIAHLVGVGLGLFQVAQCRHEVSWCWQAPCPSP